MKISGFFKCIYCTQLHFIHIIIAFDMQILFPFSLFIVLLIYTLKFNLRLKTCTNGPKIL